MSERRKINLRGKLLYSIPIYDQLLKRMLKNQGKTQKNQGKTQKKSREDAKKMVN